MYILKKLTSSLLSLLLVFTYTTPLLAQVNSEYEIVPPVTNSSDPLINKIPDVDASSTTTNLQQDVKPLQGRVVTAPRGTNFEVVTANTLNSMSSRVGDTFSASIGDPLIIDSQVVIPAGSEMIGQITFVESAGRVGKNALMDIRFTTVKLPNGERVPLNAKIITSDSSGVLRGGRKSNIVFKAAGTAAGTTAAGAVAGVSAGAILGSIGTGAIFGTAVGGLVGVGYAIYRKGKEIVLPSGTKLGVTLEQPLTLSNSRPGSY